jgi:putative endonuclease
MKEFYVYMMTNRSRVALYTGVTSKLEGRVWEHKNHVVRGFTSKYKVDRLVYYEQFVDSISAITREKEIKAWRREKKNDLVRKLNPRWEDLSKSLFGDSRNILRTPRNDARS